MAVRKAGRFVLPLCLAALVAVPFLVYRVAVSAYFFEDDFQWLAGTLTYHPASVFDLADRTHFYRPVIELYFWAATPLFAGSPVLFHLANVALHAVNTVLLFLLAREIGRTHLFGFSAALMFAVLPGYVEAVAWVGALAEPLGALFGLLAILCLLAYRRSGHARWRVLSVASFLLSLLTHESSLVFLAILILADWTAGARAALIPATRVAWLHAIRSYGPYIIIAALYLAVDFSVNRRGYLIQEGHYRLGLHAVPNMLSYIVSLYVGERNIASYAATVIVLIWVLTRGTRGARFAVSWMLLALLPFVFFGWSNVSRYQYLPGMGFALLLAEGIAWIARVLAPRVTTLRRAAIVGLVLAVVTVRFAVFATKAVSNFTRRTEAYRQFATHVRQAHPQLAPGEAVFISAEEQKRLTYRYVEALVRWEYRDPRLRVIVAEAKP